MALVKTEEKTLVRDTANMALLNADIKARDDYISRKTALNETKKLRLQVQEMANDIRELQRILRGNN